MTSCIDLVKWRILVANEFAVLDVKILYLGSILSVLKCPSPALQRHAHPSAPGACSTGIMHGCKPVAGPGAMHYNSILKQTCRNHITSQSCGILFTAAQSVVECMCVMYFACRPCNSKFWQLYKIYMFSGVQGFVMSCSTSQPKLMQMFHPDDVLRKVQARRNTRRNQKHGA